MNERITDKAGRTWVTDDALGFIWSTGEANERILLGAAQDAGLGIKRVPGGFGRSGLDRHDAHVVVEQFRPGYGRDAVFVRECPETAQLLELVQSLEADACLDDALALQIAQKRIDEAWPDLWEAFKDCLPARDAETVGLWCDAAGVGEAEFAKPLLMEASRDGSVEFPESPADGEPGAYDGGFMRNGGFMEAFRKATLEMPDGAAMLAAAEAEAAELHDEESPAP